MKLFEQLGCFFQLTKDHSTISDVLFGRNLRLKVALTLWERNVGELLTFFLKYVPKFCFQSRGISEYAYILFLSTESRTLVWLLISCQSSASGKMHFIFAEIFKTLKKENTFWINSFFCAALMRTHPGLTLAVVLTSFR